ncbi:MAG: MltR family transcriptional regulator [Verrucomicrobiota bacterium]
MKKTLPNDDAEFLTRRNQVFRELANESDRGVVLVGATLLEENLELVLRSVMRQPEKALKDVVAPLFQGTGAFATFSAKIKCCYAFNLIDETALKDLETIREIRNEFAHSYQTASFLSQSIKDKIANLSSGKVIEDKLTNPDTEIDVILEEGKPGIKMSVTKRRFVMSVAFLSSYFEAHIMEFRNFRSKTE